MSRATPIGRPTMPSQRGQHGGRQDRGRHQQRPQAGEQVAEVLADAHAEQPVQGREDDLDRRAGSRRHRVRPARDVAASQLRDGERPAHETERLDEGRGRPDDDREAP